MSNEISNAELKNFYQKLRKNRGYLVSFQNLTRSQRQWLRSSYMHHKRLESQLVHLQNRLAGKIYEDMRKQAKSL